MTTVYLNDSVESCWDIDDDFYFKDGSLKCKSTDLSEYYVIPLTSIKYLERCERE